MSTLAIVSQLRREAPTATEGALSTLAQLVDSYIKGSLSTEQFQQTIKQDASIIQLIVELAGTEISSENRLISFGNSNQTGNITINDVAAGNIVKIQINTAPVIASIAEREHLVEAAKAFLQVKEYKKALDRIGRAIDLLPSVSLYMLEGSILSEYGDKNSAWISFTNALLLANSDEERIEGRLARLRLKSWGGEAQEDIILLKRLVTGATLGEVIYYELETLAGDHLLFTGDRAREGVELGTRAVELGFTHPNLFLRLSEAHCGEHNYGLAYKNLELYFQQGGKDLEFAWGYKGFLLARMGRIQELHNLYKHVKKYHPNGNYLNNFDLTLYELEVDIMCLYAIEYKYRSDYDRETARRIIRVFAPWLPQLEKKYPQIAVIVREMLQT